MDPGPKDSCSSRPIPLVDHGPGGEREGGKVGGAFARGDRGADPGCYGQSKQDSVRRLGGLFLPAGR